MPPRYRSGDMLTPDHFQQADLTLLACHSTLVEKDYEDQLVMNQGILLQARHRWPDLPQYLPDAFWELTGNAEIPEDLPAGIRYKTLVPAYGLIISSLWPRRRLGLFQNRFRFDHDPDLEIIQNSTQQLLEFLQEQHTRTVTVHLNWPGMEADCAERRQAEQILAVLPDTVTIWELPPDGSLDFMPF